MFDFLWTKKHIPFKVEEVSGNIAPLIWSEHCVECAAPTCYGTCKRYKRRRDGNCIRIKEGFSPLDGTMNQGIKVSFRSWAKIESPYTCFVLPASSYKRLCRFFLFGDLLFRSISATCFKICCHRLSKFFTDGWYSMRMRIIGKITQGRQQAKSLSLTGVVTNPNNCNKELLIDLKSDSRLVFRGKISLNSGANKLFVPIPSVKGEKERYYLNIHPSNAEDELDIFIKSLELIESDSLLPKIKCLIWDLDNTLWDGVLIEDNNVKLRGDFVELIKELDKKGIIHSISSKNNESDAIAKLAEFGIVEYFVFNKINWHPKAQNIAKTIKQLNIKSDTIVFIDDNPFERSQVSESIENITCIDPAELLDYAKSERFSVIFNEDSAKRRFTYKMMEQRIQEEDTWDGNIDDFLRSCKLQVTLSIPDEKTIDRCYELLQRSNQLNASGRRLSFEEVERIVADKSRYLPIVISANDKFGDYGVVSFMIINRADALITDFVMSCRVANRKIEPTVIDFLATKYFNGMMSMVFLPTNKNAPMKQIITDLAMQQVNENIFCYQHQEQPLLLTIIDNILKEE